jgi:hypothetical protein
LLPILAACWITRVNALNPTAEAQRRRDDAEKVKFLPVTRILFFSAFPLRLCASAVGFNATTLVIQQAARMGSNGHQAFTGL